MPPKEPSRYLRVTRDELFSLLERAATRLTGHAILTLSLEEISRRADRVSDIVYELRELDSEQRSLAQRELDAVSQHDTKDEIPF